MAHTYSLLSQFAKPSRGRLGHTGNHIKEPSSSPSSCLGSVPPFLPCVCARVPPGHPRCPTDQAQCRAAAPPRAHQDRGVRSTQGRAAVPRACRRHQCTQEAGPHRRSVSPNPSRWTSRHRRDVIFLPSKFRSIKNKKLVQIPVTSAKAARVCASLSFHSAPLYVGYFGN